MLSGFNWSKDLNQLIRSIGNASSKQEEDKIIINEVQYLKKKLKEKNISPKKVKEMLIRAIYIEMLGHDASFIYINAINLTQSQNLALKRLGYLCCSLFLDKDSEFLILLVATLQKDLESSNCQVVVNVLTAVGKLIRKSFVDALKEPVLKLLNHNNHVVRKKALIVMSIIRQLNQDCITEQDYDDKIRRGLQDKELNVVGAAISLYHEEMKRGFVNKYKSLTGTFVSMLKQIIEHKIDRDYHYHRFPAPWLQIKLLQILTYLGANDLKVSEQIYIVLDSALRRAEDKTMNIGYALTYQCVKCISGIYPNKTLIYQAANSVSRFLKSENNNLKYLGISALTQIVSIQQKYVLEHQAIIVDCLESNDDILKKKTLELLYRMTNEQNCEVIIQKLIHFLKTSSDSNIKKDLFVKISLLNEKHAPTQEWFINTANTLFEFGSEFIDNDIRNNFFKLLSDNFHDIGSEFGVFITEKYSELLKNELQDNILKIVCWVIGEISSQTYNQDPYKLNQLTQLVIKQLDFSFQSDTTVSWIITCLAKLQSARAFQMFDQTSEIFQKYMQSRNLDCQQRAIDFYTLAKFNAALKGSQFINIDPKMSFLDAYVKQERLNGAQPYNPSLQVKAITLGSAAEAPSINFIPSSDNIYGDSKTTTQGIEENQHINQNPQAPIISGPWNDKGYTQKYKQAPPPSKPSNAIPICLDPITNIQNQSTYVQPIRPLSPQEDPKIQEKQKLADQLFISTSSQTQKQQQSTLQKGITAISQQIPMNTNTHVIQQPQSILPIQIQDIPQQKQQIIKQFLPVNINVDQFEQLWERNKNIEEATLQSKIKTEQDFTEMIQSIKLDIIKVIYQEIICSGANAENKGYVLLYGCYDSNGLLDLKIKSRDPGDGEYILNLIKRQFC